MVMGNKYGGYIDFFLISHANLEATAPGELDPMIPWVHPVVTVGDEVQGFSPVRLFVVRLRIVP